MFGVMIDTGPKFCAVPSSPQCGCDLKVKVLEFLCLSFVLKFVQCLFFKTQNGYDSCLV